MVPCFGQVFPGRTQVPRLCQRHGGSTDLPGLSLVEMLEPNSSQFGEKVFSLMGPHGSLTSSSLRGSPAFPLASPLPTCSVFSLLLGVGSTLPLPSYVGIHLQGRLKLGLNGFICEAPDFFLQNHLFPAYLLIQPGFVPACARHRQRRTALTSLLLSCSYLPVSKYRNQ